MSSRDSKILSILKRNGSSQASRYRKDLDPDQLALMGFGEEDWILFAYNFAQKLNFYNNNDEIEGDWNKFFQELNLNPSKLNYENNFDLEEIKSELKSILIQYQNNGDLSPHLTLFVSFLKILETSRSKFNQLTKRHLDFYYTEVLKMEKLPPSSDSVYVILDLAKNALNQRIEARTQFNAGKNEEGKPLIYINPEESSINSITVKSIKNIYHKQEEKIKIIKQSVLLDINGGESETLKNKQSWWTFGHTDLKDELLENPRFGFVISSNILLLHEGQRTINLTFETTVNFNYIQFISISEIFISTEKEWIQIKDGQISEIDESTDRFSFKIELENSFPSVVPLITGDPRFDELNPYPALKFLVNTDSLEGYNIFQELSTKEIKRIKVQVQVEGVKNIHLENDQTTLNPQKPFFPFTTRPFKGSSFSFSYPEAFSKNCTKLDLRFDWKNTPENFAKHYELYMSGNSKIISSHEHFKYNYQITQNGMEIGSKTRNITDVFEKNTNINGVFYFKCHISNQIKNISNAKVKVNLLNSFLHEVYPKLNATILSSRTLNKILPNEPYTPLASDLSLDYEAEVEFSQNPLENKIIHIHPFGFSEGDSKFLVSSQYNQAGYLYIGLANARPNDILSLLFQMDDGTENPLSVDIEPIQWAILRNNTWQNLPKESILLNETLNFLRSGIVKIELPSVIDTNNTLFAPGLLWIRAQLLGAHDAVCRCINIHSQAVRLQALYPLKATHLPEKLENGVISKLERRVSQIKSVSQPYASFGGRGIETDINFYRRVSERLRHKNRAVTQWDYEHLILEEFPDLILVKCLNHTRPNTNGTPACFNAPGHVTIVVVPSTKQFDPEKIIYPRVSSAKREEIKIFISNHISPAMEIHVINPEYEKLKVTVNIKISPGLDKDFYQKQLKKDITNFLSPWAFENNLLLNFNKEFHKSQILFFIENLSYIDYISKLELSLEDKPIENTVRATAPSSIIVSDESHLVAYSIDNCAKV